MKTYLYDSTFDGLLTAIFYAYQDTGENIQISTATHHVPNLFEACITICTEEDKAERVYTSLENKLSKETLSNVYHLYLSDVPQIETLILDYVKLCYKYSASINLAKNNDIISKVDKWVRRVTHEAHRFNGFVRFKELSPLVFYAQIEPDHNILPLLASHFEERFSDQHFIIHDLKRHDALVYNLKEIYLQSLTPEEETKLTAHQIEDPFETLFKSFYKAATIEDRLNVKRRNALMPRRYFKHLTEL